MRRIKQYKIKFYDNGYSKTIIGIYSQWLSRVDIWEPQNGDVSSAAKNMVEGSKTSVMEGKRVNDPATT